MTDAQDIYISPLVRRYASDGMARLFGRQKKFSTWRRLWLTLAEGEKQLGLNITDEQIRAMSEHLDDVDFHKAADYEKKFRHDVMAHIHAFGDAAPQARGIIHLGATSQYVVDNTDLILIKDALKIILARLVNVIDALGKFAREHRSVPALGFTHFQPAQLTTVGKRAATWCADFVVDLNDVEYRLENLAFRSIKGATGTQASFMALFDGDESKVKKLENFVADKMGFSKTAPVTGQTYSRKTDAVVAQVLASIAASAQKFCNDMRLLAHRREMFEPFGTKQVGSSAMPYKRNPMRCERATALARYLMDVAQSPLHTAAQQWLERTLDDSANRRLAIPESFLAADAILLIIHNVASGMTVNKETIESDVRDELPFIATENILMSAVRAGGDRQKLHEKIRRYAVEAMKINDPKKRGKELLEKIADDDAFAEVELKLPLDPADYTGRAPRQVDEFLTDYVEPVRKRYADLLSGRTELRV